MGTLDPVIGLGAVGAMISGVGAGVALALRARATERLTAIRGASQDDKARLVADAVVMFKIPVDGLRAEQRYSLVIKQLEDRDRQRQRTFIFALALMLVLASTTVVLALLNRSAIAPVPAQPGAADARPPAPPVDQVAPIAPGGGSPAPPPPVHATIRQPVSPAVPSPIAPAMPPPRRTSEVNLKGITIDPGAKIRAGNVTGNTGSDVATKVDAENAKVGSGATVNVGNVDR